jgi:hypothetical protein
MERIVIRVDELVAKAWRTASSDKRKEISNEMSVRIGKELLQKSNEEFVRYLGGLRSMMEERGLTASTLNDILNQG